MQRADRVPDLREGLDAADRLLHPRREILHPKAGAIDANLCQRGRKFGRQMAGIEFNRMFDKRRKIEGRADPACNRHQPFAA